MGTMMCFQRVEINVSFTELYICICLLSVYSQDDRYRLSQRTARELLAWCCTHNCVWILPLQVRYTAERETQMQKTCIQRVETLFLASVISDRFFKWLFQSSISKRRDDWNHARILISTEKKIKKICPLYWKQRRRGEVAVCSSALFNTNHTAVHCRSIPGLLGDLRSAPGYHRSLETHSTHDGSFSFPTHAVFWFLVFMFSQSMYI